MTVPTPPERKHPRAWAILAGAPGPFPSDFALTLPIGANSTAPVERWANEEPAPALLAHAQFTLERGSRKPHPGRESWAKVHEPGPYSQAHPNLQAPQAPPTGGGSPRREGDAGEEAPFYSLVRERDAFSPLTSGRSGSPSRSPSPSPSLSHSRAQSPQQHQSRLSAREALGASGLISARESLASSVPWPADFSPPPEVVPTEEELAAARALPRAAVARAISRGSTLFATHAPSDFALKLVPQPRATSPLSRSSGSSPSPLIGGSFVAAASAATVAATVRGGLLGSAVAPLLSQNGGIGAGSLRFGGACAALAPHSLRFGTLRVGQVYEADVFLHNLSRAERPLSFRADAHHAVPRGGAHAGNSVVLLHEAGPLARGMSRALTVRIYCRREGVISETVGVCCPGEELPLPCTARVVSAEGFESLGVGVRHAPGSSVLPSTSLYWE
jgi:hypothetical protein